MIITLDLRELRLFGKVLNTGVCALESSNYFFPHSLNDNNIGSEGVKALWEGLKHCATLQELQ